jgi:hypothetical protein
VGKTNTIERVPKIRDRDSINIIARALVNADRDSVAIAPSGDSADGKINARVRDVDSADGKINARVRDVEDRDSIVTTNDLAIVVVATTGDPTNNASRRATIGDPTNNAARRRDTNKHNKRRPTPSEPSTTSPT